MSRPLEITLMDVRKDLLIDPIAIVLGQGPFLARIAGNDQEVEQQRFDGHLDELIVPKGFRCAVAVAMLIKRAVTLIKCRAKVFAC